MTPSRKILISFAGLLGALGAGMLIGILLVAKDPNRLTNLLKPSNVVTDKNNPVILAFLMARQVPFKPADRVYPAVRAWDSIVDFCGTQQVRLMAFGGIGGDFTCQFSDEAEARTIGHPGDYVYPCDLRIDRNTNRIYAKASGLAGGLYQDTVIFEFDLQARKTIATVHVNPAILPSDPSL